AEQAELAVRLGETVAGDRRARAVCYTRSAEALYQLGRIDDAKARLAAALTEDERHVPALLALGDLGLNQSDWGVACDAAERQAEALKDPQSRAHASLLAGIIAEEELRDRARALLAYKRTLALLPKSQEAFDRARR